MVVAICGSQPACSSDDDCFYPELCYTFVCDSGDQVYQQCYNPSDVDSYDDSCTVTLVDSASVTPCISNADCTTSGDCCIQQVCYDQNNQADSNGVCGAQTLVGTNTDSTNGCSYVSCTPEPQEYPCSTTDDCSTLYALSGFCCAAYNCSSTDSDSDETLPQYCVNSLKAGLSQPYQFYDSACTALCLVPTDAYCVTVPDSATGVSSQCGVLDTDDDSYCC